MAFLVAKDARDYNEWPYYVKDFVNGSWLAGCAAMSLWAGFRGGRRAGDVTAGTLAAFATTFVGLTAGFFFEAARGSMLEALVTPLPKPFMFVILAIMLSPSLMAGAVGGFVGRRFTSSERRDLRAS